MKLPISSADRVQILRVDIETTKEGELTFPEEDESLDWGMPSEGETYEESLREPLVRSPNLG